MATTEVAATATEWRRSNWTTYRYCIIVSLGAVLFGFDQASISGLIAIARFEERFGEHDAASDSWILTAGDQTLLYGLLVVGAFLASAVSGPIGSRLGRKPGLYLCAGLSVIGPVVQIVATSLGVEVFGRFLTGLGIGFAANFCGVYWTEITPAPYRGLVLMLYQAIINVANFVGACIIQGVYRLDNAMAWRTQLFVMMSAPLAMLVLIPLLPETPRWYVTKGRYDEALQSLIKIRGPTWPVGELQQEMDTIVSMYELERNLEGNATYRDCFRHTNLRRTRIIVLMAITQSFTGISFISGYGTVFFQLSGIQNAFLITVITSVCGMAGSLAAFPLVRWVGRRPLLLWGALGCGLSMFLFAVIGVAKPDSTAASTCLVVFVCLYLFCYGSIWGPVPYLYGTEIASNGVRSKAVSMMNSAAFFANLFITCGSPYLISTQYANIGTRLGFIFGGITLLSLGWMYFEFPETKDRTLEEIDEMFMNRLPARKFKDYICQGTVTGREEEFTDKEKGASTAIGTGL